MTEQERVPIPPDRQTFYVYLAGPLSGAPSEYLANVARLTRMSRVLIEDGFTPINPAADLLEGLVSTRALPLETYQRRGMELLRLLAGHQNACLYRLLHADGRGSRGVRAEIKEAERLGIRVCRSWRELCDWREELRR